jgi:hypothetical protein
MRSIARWLPTLLTFCLPATRLFAPTHVLIDIRPAARHAVIEAIGRAENCPHNIGCQVYAGQLGARRGRNGYAVFDTAEHERRAIARWIDRRACLPLREMLPRYNAQNARYAEVILGMAGVPGDLVLGSRCE